MASLFSSASSERARPNGSGRDSRHLNNGVSSFDKVIKLLLKQYPQAAQTPHGRSGRLPLVLAARAGHRTWNDGMKRLLRAYPPALFSGSKGMVPIKLYPYVLSLIGGGGPPPPPPPCQSTLTSEPSLSSSPALTLGRTVPSARSSATALGGGSNHSLGSAGNDTYWKDHSTTSGTNDRSSHSSSDNTPSPSTHSSLLVGTRRCISRFKGRRGIGMLHNTLLLKQRHIRELMIANSTTAAGTASNSPVGGVVATPPRRQRNHLHRDYHTSVLPNGSGQITSHLRNRNPSLSSFAPNQHSHAPPLIPQTPATTYGGGSSNNTRSMNNNSTSHKNYTSSNFDPRSDVMKGTRVDPKSATTLFELLRTKPDLVEVGRSYQAELNRASVGSRRVASLGETYLQQRPEQQPPPLHWTRKKKPLSRTLLERMTVFERKGRKTLTTTMHPNNHPNNQGGGSPPSSNR